MSDPQKPDSWSVYVLRCGDGSYYCGISTDVPRRLEQHREGKAARYTRGRSPLELRAEWRCDSRSTALRAEAAFKRKSRAAKERWLAETDALSPTDRPI